MANFYFVVFVFSSLYSTYVAEGQCANGTMGRAREDELLKLIEDLRNARNCAEQKLAQCTQDQSIKKCNHLLHGKGIRILTSSTHISCKKIQNYHLNQKNEGGAAGGWCSNNNKPGEYVEVELPKVHKITGVVTQGRHDYDQWVTQYRVLYSKDCVKFNNEGKLYAGNYDRHTQVTNYLDSPLIARCIRISPVKYHKWMSMRFDILGCDV